MDRIPLGVIGAELALRLIEKRLTGRYAGVAAVFEPDEATLIKLSGTLEANGVYIFRNLKKFLSCGIRAVIIRGSTDSAEYAIKALRRELDVLSEPPMAMNAEQITRIERAAKDTGRKYSLALYSCHRRDVLLAGRLLERGDIGHLIYAEASERVKPLPGAPIGIMSCHGIGRILVSTKLKLRGSDLFEASLHESSVAVGTLKLSGGAIGRSLCGNIGMRNELRLIGENGSIETVGGRVILNRESGGSIKSTSILPEGFGLHGMLRGTEFSASSAIAGFCAMLLGDAEATERSIELSRASEITLASISDSDRALNIPSGSPYGFTNVSKH